MIIEKNIHDTIPFEDLEVGEVCLYEGRYLFAVDEGSSDLDFDCAGGVLPAIDLETGVFVILDSLTPVSSLKGKFMIED